MSYGIAVDINNDIFVDSNGNLATVRNLDCVSQTIAAAVETQLGELIFNTTAGMPNFQTIWSGSPNIAQFQSALRTIILGVTGVVEVLSITTNIIESVLTYTAVIATIYGQYVLSQEVPNL